MKRILILLLLLISGSSYAQKIPDFGFDRVHIVEKDKTIKAEIIPYDGEPGIKSDRFYYWYSANAIHSTQGGYSGQLLNGEYEEYYPDNNLKEQGNFRKGLKIGVWKSWNEDGTLLKTSKWKNGLLLPGHKVPIWKKLDIFKRKPKQHPADSLAQKNKVKAKQ